MTKGNLEKLAQAATALREMAYTQRHLFGPGTIADNMDDVADKIDELIEMVAKDCSIT